MKSKIIAAFMATQIFSGVLFSETKALVVTIHQAHLSGVREETIQMLPMLLGALNLDNFGDMKASLEGFKTKILALSDTGNLNNATVIEAWDQSRSDWVKSQASKKYDAVFVLVGHADLSSDHHVKKVWQEAFMHDHVDYVSLVHTGDQYIREEWQVPKQGKLRMVYSSACRGGDGANHFIKDYHAIASCGHTDETEGSSASPLFSFAFLNAWLDGASFKDSLSRAWEQGKNILSTKEGFMLAQLIGGYANAHDAIGASWLKYAWTNAIDPATFTIDSQVTRNDDCEDIMRANIAQ